MKAYVPAATLTLLIGLWWSLITRATAIVGPATQGKIRPGGIMPGNVPAATAPLAGCPPGLTTPATRIANSATQVMCKHHISPVNVLCVTGRKIGI